MLFKPRPCCRVLLTHVSALCAQEQVPIGCQLTEPRSHAVPSLRSCKGRGQRRLQSASTTVAGSSCVDTRGCRAQWWRGSGWGGCQQRGSCCMHSSTPPLPLLSSWPWSRTCRSIRFAKLGTVPDQVRAAYAASLVRQVKCTAAICFAGRGCMRPAASCRLQAQSSLQRLQRPCIDSPHDTSG